jgi:hypothetical protein
LKPKLKLLRKESLKIELLKRKRLGMEKTSNKKKLVIERFGKLFGPN